MDYAYVEASRGLATATYVDQLLHGANAADLPMRPPPEVELVINLNAAQAISYSIPPTALARATDVIR
jgi:putative tryptophan/tyrosine transport system substrate-binding protein